jgi:hypothetical protein
MNLKGNRFRRINESYDLYDVILSHLLDEGYANTPEAAEVIMVNMSEEWLYHILEDRAPIATDLEKARQRLTRYQSDVNANTPRGTGSVDQTQYDRRGFHKLNRGRRGRERMSPNPVRRWARQGEPGGPDWGSRP